MKLTEIAIKRPVFAWMIMASFIIFGSISFTSLGISERPDVDFPVASVNLRWEGAAPEVIELDVVDILESNLLAVEGIKSITSEAKRGSANITLEFDIGQNIDAAVQEIQSIIAQSQRFLPSDLEPPIVRKSNPEDRPILWLSITSDQMSRRDLMVFVRDQIKDRFQTIDGVSEVILGGYIDPNLRVWASEKKLKQYDLSILDLVSAISAEHAEYPAGVFENPKKEYNIRILGETVTPEDFSKIAINRRAGQPNFTPIFLGQVATVEDDLADVRRISRVMGKPTVGLGIRKQSGVNSVAVAQAIKARMKQVARSLPKGAEIGINYDGTVFVEEAIGELQFTLIIAAIMTSLVVWFFLGSFGASFNIMLSIPTVVIATFMALKLFGFTLNTFTMLGLTLAVGLIVDDNIMILENISRIFKKNKNAAQAALEGTKEISFAALAASSAIIAIFLPIGFISGMVGRYFFEFSLTISAAIALSFVDAVTLTPMRAMYLLKSEAIDKMRWIDGVMERLEVKYYRSLKWSLNHKLTTLGISLIILFSSVIIYKNIKQEFLPPQDQSRLFMIMKTKPGSSLEFTDNKIKEIEKIMLTQPEIQRYFVAVGGFGGDEANSAVSYITLRSIKDRPINTELGRKLTQQEFSSYLRDKLRAVEGVFVIIQDPSLSGFSAGRSYPIEFSLTGPDWDKLIELSQLAQDIMKESGMVSDIDTNYRGRVPELRILPDRDKALKRGVSVDDIGRTIQSMVSGIVAGKFAKGGRRYDIRVKIKDSELTDISDISKIMVRNNRGELVSLSEVTKIEEQEGLLSITRDNRARAVALFANLAPGASQAEALDLIAEKVGPKLPKDYLLIQSGAAQTFQESSSSLIFVLVLGIIIAYMILASQFNSFIHPITILSALPFSLVGAMLALWLFSKTLNIYSMIGVILLMGIVKKNSIILVDFTNQMKEQGLSTIEALLKACPIRLRPIVMTSVSTMAGTLPAALAMGPGSETRIPMALAVIGGVLVSTFLTLYVVPCLYSLFSRKS